MSESTQPELVTQYVPKRCDCKECPEHQGNPCGHTWTGPTFLPLKPGESERLQHCDPCTRAWEARLRSFTEYRPAQEASKTRPKASDLQAPAELSQEPELWHEK